MGNKNSTGGLKSEVKGLNVANDMGFFKDRPFDNVFNLIPEEIKNDINNKQELKKVSSIVNNSNDDLSRNTREISETFGNIRNMLKRIPGQPIVFIVVFLMIFVIVLLTLASISGDEGFRRVSKDISNRERIDGDIDLYISQIFGIIIGGIGLVLTTMLTIVFIVRVILMSKVNISLNKLGTKNGSLKIFLDVFFVILLVIIFGGFGTWIGFSIYNFSKYGSILGKRTSERTQFTSSEVKNAREVTYRLNSILSKALAVPLLLFVGILVYLIQNTFSINNIVNLNENNMISDIQLAESNKLVSEIVVSFTTN
jgi:hypothetical protein